MDARLILPVVFRWMHILAAVIAVGGTIFMRFVLAPAVKQTLSDEQHAALRAKIIERWKIAVMACITALLVSGTYNFIVTSVPKVRVHPSYAPLFAVKALAALGVFFIASVLTGRSPAFQPMRQKSGHWMKIAALLGVTVILISGVLSKLSG